MSSQCSNYESLIAMIHAIQPGGDPSLYSIDHIDELVHTILDVTSNSASYRLPPQFRDEVQVIVDSLFWVLRAHPSLNSRQKVKIRAALCELSVSSDVLPTSFRLPRFTHARRVSETPDVDVYQGTCQGRVVCLKKYRFYRLKPESARKLVTMEAVIRSTHTHQGIVPFLGATRGIEDPLDPGLYLVSQFYPAGTILQYLSAFPKADRFLLLRDVVHAVVYIHSHHLAHGGVKGANVLVTASGRACVADCGLPSISVDAAQALTQVSLSTVPWMAPELLLAVQSEGMVYTLTPATDIYSLGCLAYEIFTEKAPFAHLLTRGGSSIGRLWAIIEAIVNRDERPEKPHNGSNPYVLHGLTAGVWRMMDHCWSKDPSIRPCATDLSRLTIFTDIVDERPTDQTYSLSL